MVVMEFIDEGDEAAGVIVTSPVNGGNAGQETGMELAGEFDAAGGGAGAFAKCLELEPGHTVTELANGDWTIVDDGLCLF